MESRPLPDPDVMFPVPNVNTVTYVKPTIKNKNIVVGDFTYFSDIDFEKHVTHFYEFYNDRLVIGRFCQIASGVEFVMNGANHQMGCVSTFPFYIFEKWDESVPSLDKLPVKGDTIVGNDVWIGQDATILPGVRIGDGAIIGMKSVVGSDVEPYTIVAGNPAKVIRRRFDEELIGLMLKLEWWNLPIEEINKLIPLLHDNNAENVKERIREIVE
ncbi:MAG: CatB-related O-acetyltransferase [Oscillospiraceae bacterium]|jgi:virginiamycin A acetyltransferase|nr:CatB-related O-acetyltransferase [Oscillospiraceae bacterium]